MKDALPPLAPVPPVALRLSISPSEWEVCLQVWLSLADLYLRLPSSAFTSITRQQENLEPFLTSLYRELGHLQPSDSSFSGSPGQRLRELSFLLTNRCIFDTDATQTWLVSLDFLSDLTRTYARSTAILSKLTSRLWSSRRGVLEASLQKRKNQLIISLESQDPSTGLNDLASLLPFLRSSTDAGAFFMLGSDFIAALQTAYEKLGQVESRKTLVNASFSCLSSLPNASPPMLSLLSDHLYSLKGSADKQSGKASLLADLITNSPLLAVVRQALALHTHERLNKLLDTLETYRMPSIAHPRRHVRSRSRKDKGKSKAGDGEYHMHRFTLVSQIQDLFPDLGSGFILKLLDEYNENVEEVTAHLLDDSLPTHLNKLDRTEQTLSFEDQQKIDYLAPRSTPPPSEPFVPDRKNVFDNDELDPLDLGTQRLHIGKKSVPSETDHHPNKAAILSALAAFDSDDDERDDTYDVEDVGGTIDTAHPEGEPSTATARPLGEETDMALFTAYRAHPELFGRTFDVRRGQARAALKQDTGMTDEAIEGWAVMLQRDPNRLRKLESRATAFDGRQNALPSTSYRESPGATDNEDSDAQQHAFEAGRGRGLGRGRGRGGRGGRGRGAGNVAGPSNEAGTANAQRKKEANKGSRANHNRRDQRARKMARGGFAG